MSDRPPPPELLAHTRQRAEQYRDEHRSRSTSSGKPCLGDLYLFEAQSDPFVQWVLVAQDPADSKRFLAIPADAHFLVGSGDVSLPDQASLGALTLRCRFGVWIDASQLKPEQRIGVLASSFATQARQRWFELGQDEVRCTVLEREVDDDPEYQDWVKDVLQPARQALLDAGVGRAALQARPTQEPKGVGRRPFFMLLAATVLLVVITGIFSFQLWRQQRSFASFQAAQESVKRQHRQEIEALEAARRSLEAEYQLKLGSAESEQAETIRSYEERLAALDRRLEALQRSTRVINPAIALLDPPQVNTRGRIEIHLPNEATHLVLLITLRQPDKNARYRLEVRPEGSTVSVWASDALRVEEPRELRVGIARELMPAGEYTLLLSRQVDGRFREVGEYILEVLP